MDEMIRRGLFKKLTKLTYGLETKEEDGLDDQTRGNQTIDRVHVRAGEHGIG